MKKLEKFIKHYKGALEDLFYEIYHQNHLDQKWNYWIETTIDYIATNRDIIEERKQELTPEQKKQLEELDQKLLEIYDHLKGTQYEEMFVNYLKPYLPTPTTV